MITEFLSDTFMIKATTMDHLFQNVLLILLRIVVTVYTYLTIPIYYFLQKPNDILKKSKKIRAKQLNPNDPKSIWFSVLDRKDYCGSVIDIVETIDEMCNKIGEYLSLKDRAVGYRRVIREYIVYGTDGITPLKSDGKIIKKRELSDYDWLTYEQLFERKNMIAKGLLRTGIKHNEPIAILCETCAEYLMMEFAIARAGFVQVNVFATLGESGIAHAIKETNSKYIFTSWDLIPKIRSVIQTYNLNVKKIIYIERRAENVSMEIIEKEQHFIQPINQAQFVSLNEIESGGRQSSNDDDNDNDEMICKPLDKNQVAFIVFTSGSTGIPKGVQLTSNQMIQVCHQMLPSLSEYICNGQKNIYVAYLPQAHIFESTCEFLIFALGIPIGFASPFTLTESSPGLATNTKSDLVLLRPTFMISVPLVLQRIQKQIYNKLESRSSFHVQLFNYLMKYKIDWTEKGYKTPLINKIFCKKIREQFGGRLDKIIVGGAPLSTNLQSLIKAALDTKLVQGYGMTETCGACFAMDNDDLSYGRSGPPMLNVYAKLDDWNDGGYRTSDLPYPRGELLVGSKANCLGYLNNPEATNELIVKDKKLGINWIRSGDIAEVFPDGTFKIVDRKKDLVKMANGEYVSLGKIETTLKNCGYIDHICVFGNALANYLVALVVPNAEKMGHLAKIHRIPNEALRSMNHRLSDILLKSVRETGIENGLKKMEIPTKIQIVSDEWTSDNEMLTAAMKLKRCSIKSRYFSVINDLFDDSYAFNFSTFYLISLNSTTIDPSSIIHNNNNNNNNDELKYDLLINDNSFKNLDKINDLNVRVRELLRIRSSVLKELRSLERNRTSIIQELTEHNNELEKLKSTIGKKSNELERLQLHIKQAVVAQKEAKVLVGSMIEPPLNLLPKQAQAKNFIENEKATISHLNHNECQMHNCFDYSRCSLFSSFFVFIYNHDDDHHHVRSSFDQIIYDKFRSNIHVTNDPRIACIYLLIISEHFPYWNDRISFQNYLAALPYWAGDGRNHIIFNMNPKIDLNSIELNVKKAIIVQNQFSKSFSSLRHSFDLVIPNVQIIHSFNENLKVKNFSPKLSPAKRKYFLTFLGHLRHENSDHNNNNTAYDDNLQLIIKNTMLNLLTKHSVVNHNEFLFDFDCDEKTKKLCDNQTIILLESTFTLIPIIIINNNSFHHDFYQRLFNALSTGSIPIIISNNIISLPFEDVIDWRKATIRLPIARITELYVLLKTYTDADIIELRRYGLHFYQTYFANLDKFIATFFAYFGTYRLQIPPSSPPSYRSIYYYNQPKYDIQFNSSDSLLTNSLIYDNDPSSDGDEFLGPIEPPFASISYHRNYSITMNNLYSIWNDISLTPFHTFPSLPFDPVLPSESKFIGSSYGFRPIGAGLGGSGKEFSEALGGNHIREQFTIVILTYERENVLLLILSHLKNLPYLNKVVIVWNSPQPPSTDIIWPDIGVDIVVIKSERNSLNNRFIPFDEIKTEAILSIDDDTNLRHDEIIFAFRVWREARDRIVGFPARFHSYETNEKSWYYNSSYTCEYSMILTGAAFFHKYYSYLYSYSMSSLIRDKVDEFMNCEDIAMNFLVSHVTRKPPIKVTSKWTFRCPACQTGLSENQSEHFLKRHKCINYFVSIYGYMPLLYTQFRADSVLFKTRVSHDKQKCFKYI